MKTHSFRGVFSFLFFILHNLLKPDEVVFAASFFNVFICGILKLCLNM